MYKTSKNTNIDVLFFIEHKDREIDITVEIAKILKHKYKLNIAIASLIYEPLSSLFQVKPKVIVTPSTAFGKGSVAWIYNMVYGTEIIYVNMNYEQFISSWKGKYKVPSHKISKEFQKHFVWGEYFKQTLVEQNINASNIYLTGRPLSTVIKKKYKDKQKKYKKEIANKLKLDINKKWLFIALTDGLAFVSEEKVNFIIKNGADEKGLREHIKYVKDTINIMIDWINKLSKEDKKYYVILRPHPSISIEQYKELFKKKLGYIPENVLISKEFNAYKWLSASDKYFTNYSTLAIDAYILGKETYIFRPIEKSINENYWWCDHGIEIRTYEDFIIYVKNENMFRNSKLELKENNYYIDFSLDGIERSGKFLYDFVNFVNQYPRGNIIKKIIPILHSPKRTLGSLLRLFLMKYKINFVPSFILKKGITIDYITKQDIDYLKKELKNEY